MCTVREIEAEYKYSDVRGMDAGKKRGEIYIRGIDRGSKE